MRKLAVVPTAAHRQPDNAHTIITSSAAPAGWHAEVRQPGRAVDEEFDVAAGCRLLVDDAKAQTRIAPIEVGAVNSSSVPPLARDRRRVTSVAERSGPGYQSIARTEPPHARGSIGVDRPTASEPRCTSRCGLRRRLPHTSPLLVVAEVDAHRVDPRRRHRLPLHRVTKPASSANRLPVRCQDLPPLTRTIDRGLAGWGDARPDTAAIHREYPQRIGVAAGCRTIGKADRADALRHRRADGSCQLLVRPVEAIGCRCDFAA